MTDAKGLDFIVLTGFLGSGKTSLLRDFVAQPEAADTAVIVNEVGEIGLDGAILSEGSGGIPVALLSNGCVCCSIGSDLAVTVDALIESRRGAPLARIILETSGVSKPGAVLRSLGVLAPRRMRVGVVATFDCGRGTAIAAFEEAAAQWASAQVMVLTKGDTVDAAGLARARTAVSQINPLAEIVDTPDRRAAVLAAFGGVRPGHRAFAAIPDPPSGGLAAQHPRIGVLLADFAAPVPWDDLAEWLDDLAGLCGDRLLRVKGLVRIVGGDLPILVQSVGTLFSAPVAFTGVPPSARSFLVIIARDIEGAAIADLAPNLPLTVTRVTPTTPAELFPG
ncbi:MAG TPA: GTP-binding protein [Stellaceae bacterium]|nr:GTP-binding protein [Stellaceae bacterium]